MRPCSKMNLENSSIAGEIHDYCGVFG